MQSPSRILLLAAFVGIWVFAAHPALSQDDDSDGNEDVYSRTGPYLGATILGASYLTISDQLSKTVADNIEQDPVLAFNVYAGYRIHRFVAVEAAFEMLPSSDLDQNVGGTLSEVEVLTGTVNAKVFLPLGQFQPFLLAGVGVADIENQPAAGINVWVSETDVVGRFGGGADFYVTKNVVAHFGVEYVLPGPDLEDFDYISYGAGIQYRF